MYLYVLASDFDGTAAKTFQPSPNGVGVEEAYRGALELLFGISGKESFAKVGGLRNRAPGELISALVREGGLELTDREMEMAPERLVQAKMNILTKEIGLSWPLPCTGFPELCRSLLKLHQEGIAIVLAILSSGHTTFIRRTFEVWGNQWSVVHPKAIVSDDDVRHLNVPLKEKVKPSPFLFDLLKGKLGPEFDIDRIIYFGDDEKKDGQLADNVGIPFGHFAPGITFRCVENGFRFSNWEVVANHLGVPENVEQLRQGGPLRKVFGL